MDLRFIHNHEVLYKNLLLYILVTNAFANVEKNNAFLNLRAYVDDTAFVRFQLESFNLKFQLEIGASFNFNFNWKSVQVST
jgi:hypothetical protein